MEREDGRPPLVDSAKAIRESKWPARLVTGHEILDAVLTIYDGTSILVLDETYSEARNFMRLIFEKYNPQLRFTEISDKASLSGIGHVEILTGDSLADKVVKMRRTAHDQTIYGMEIAKEGIVVHTDVRV